MTTEKVDDTHNFWEWEARAEDSIANVGETTTYSYFFDSLADVSGDYSDVNLVKKGVIYDDEDNYYTVPEFRKKYNALQRKFRKAKK